MPKVEPLKCTICGSYLECAGSARVKWRTLEGVSKSMRSIRSKVTRIWKCPKCGKIFHVAMRLVEVNGIVKKRLRIVETELA